MADLRIHWTAWHKDNLRMIWCDTIKFNPKQNSLNLRESLLIRWLFKTLDYSYKRKKTQTNAEGKL